MAQIILILSRVRWVWLSGRGWLIVHFKVPILATHYRTSWMTLPIATWTKLLMKSKTKCMPVHPTSLGSGRSVNRWPSMTVSLLHQVQIRAEGRMNPTSPKESPAGPNWTQLGSSRQGQGRLLHWRRTLNKKKCKEVYLSKQWQMHSWGHLRAQKSMFKIRMSLRLRSHHSLSWAQTTARRPEITGKIARSRWGRAF